MFAAWGGATHFGGVASRLLFVVTTGSLLFCTAVNCYTYRIAYPLWALVGHADFAALHRDYLRRLAPVITMPHILLFFSSGGLLLAPPASISRAVAESVFSCGTTVILLSLAAAGPVHSRFERTGFVDPEGLSRLVIVSAIRSLLLLAASLVLLTTIFRVLPR